MEIEKQSDIIAEKHSVDNIFILQQKIERRKTKNLSTHLMLVDLQEAYDTIPLKKVLETFTKISLNLVY